MITRHIDHETASCVGQSDLSKAVLSGQMDKGETESVCVHVCNPIFVSSYVLCGAWVYSVYVLLFNMFTVEAMLYSGAEVCTADSKGRTPLHFAVTTGDCALGEEHDR